MSRQTIVTLCSLFALYCVVEASYNFNDIKGAIFVGSDAYRTTSGEILASNVVYRLVGRGRGEPTEPAYNYAILYRYAVGGKEYTSNQVDFTSKLDLPNQAYAERYVRKYPVGHTVTVHYKADDPSFAVLEPQNKLGGLLWFMLLLLALIVFLLGIWYAKKPQNKSRASHQVVVR